MAKMKNSKNFFLIMISIMAFIVFSLEIFITIINQKNDLTEQMNTYLLGRAENESSILNSKISEVGFNSRLLAELISNDDTLNYDFYNAYIRERLEEQPLAFGMGYWFEPYYTHPEIKHYGPYTYKDNDGNIVLTMMYSDEEYDYFSWDWYHDGVVSDTTTHFTQPYYDAALDTVFMTTSHQIVRDNKVVGIATIGITLREVSAYINSIHFDTNGRAFIISDNGLILGEKRMFDIQDMTVETPGIHNALSHLSDRIISSDVTASAVYDGIITVWTPIGSTGMNIVFCHSEQDLMAGVYQRILVSIALFIISMVIFVLILNIALKRFFENPLRQILKYNTPIPGSENSNDTQPLDTQPNFNNMLTIIHRLFEERNSSINKLNEKNIELKVKNEEIEALYQQTSAMNNTLNQLLDEIRNGYIVTVRALSNAIEANDKYTKGHCERVTEYALSTAKMFNLSEKELTNLEYASVLHDVGKIGIPTAVLNKPGRLTDEEYTIIKEHPRTGYEMLKDIKFLEESNEIILHHHERVDGKGYPSGLKDAELSLSIKIITVADAYDAMTSSRPYREAPLTENEALDELKRNAGTQFDALVVEFFSEMIMERLNN